MINFISQAISKIGSLLNKFQAKHILSVLMVGFLLLTTNIDTGISNPAQNKKIDTLLNQDDSILPKTSGEWNKQARETEDKPGERLKRIGEQSAEAVKEFGSMYKEVAKDSADAAKK